MAGSNFIDYVKILCRSGKGGAGRTISIALNTCRKAAPTVETADVADISFCVATATCGRCST